jgi:hypothetical protein
MMETSQYFQKAMYLEQSPAAADYFEERTASLFVTDSLQSWIEVFADKVPPGNENEMLKSVQSLTPSDAMHDGLVKDLDQSQTAANENQRNKHDVFAIGPGLDLQKVSHKEDLRRFIKARLRAIRLKSTRADFPKATEYQTRVL